MMKRWLCTLIACTLLLCGTLVDGKAVRDGGDGKKPYIILSQGGVGVQKLKDILGKFNIPIDKVVQQPTTPNGASAVVVQLPPSIAQSVLSQPDVAATEEVHTFTAPPSPVSDPTSGTSTAGFSLTLSNTDGALTGDWASYAAVAVGNLSCAPWHLDRLDQTVLPLDCIYGGDATGSGVDVYVVDTGINTALDQFEGRASPFFAPEGASPGDEHGHGTFVAGIIGGKTYGTAKGVSLKSVKVFDSTGSGNTITLWQGLSAVLNRPDRTRPAIVSMSLSGDSRSPLIEYLMGALLADNVLVVSAAGNAPPNATAASNACQFTPGAATVSLTVAASDVSDKLAWWSNYGECVKIVAPGHRVWSVWNDGTHMALSGTSMAAPVVSGTAALMWGKLPGLTSKQVYRAVLKNANADVLLASSLPAGTPNLLVNALFDLAAAPTTNDLNALPGATVTPCTSATCPSASTINGYYVITQLSGGARRLARGKDGYAGKLFLSTNRGSTWSLVGLTASPLVSGSFTYDTAAQMWVCATPGLFTTSRFQYGLAAFCDQGRAYLVHDVVGPFSGKLFFRLEADPSIPFYNVLNVDTYGVTGSGVVQLTEQQNLWLYAWGGGGFIPGTSGSLDYQGEEWAVNAWNRRWLAMLSTSENFDASWIRYYFVRIMPADVIDDFNVATRRWLRAMVVQQFDYIVAEKTYTSYPALTWGGATLDVASMTRQWNPASPLTTDFASSYTPTAHISFRPGYSMDTWVKTLTALPNVYRSKSAVKTIFYNGADLLLQSQDKPGKLSRTGTLDTFITNGKTVLDVAGAATMPTPDPAGTPFGTDSLFFATSDLYLSAANVTSYTWGTTSDSIYPQYIRCLRAC